MPKYFSSFQDALGQAEIEATPSKEIDAGGDVLPLGHLDDRRFEILVYRLKYAELKETDQRVTLMQGVGERGRDVIVYSSEGSLLAIVQCKQLLNKFSAPALKRELLKIALHHHLDNTVLGTEPVEYELWCPGGLTEPAARILDAWPKSWTVAAVGDDALEVIEEFAAFKHIEWSKVGAQIVEELGRLLRPRHVTAINMTTRIRGYLPVYEAFFQGKVVMARDDVKTSLRELLAEAQGFSALGDKDAKHVLDRITSFTPDTRHVHTFGYVMGLPPELVSKFNRKEYAAFAKHQMEGLTGIVQVVLQVCSRLVQGAALAFREKAQPSNKNITHVFAKTLTMSVIARVSGMLITGLNLQPELAAYEKLTLRERLERHAKELWEEFADCLAGYVPEKHPFGSDEEFRSRIATHGIDGARNREEFEGSLVQAMVEHAEILNREYESFMSMVPQELLLISDTSTIFENKWLFERMIEGHKILERLRGSSTLPE
jgi:hypothetical protein